MRSFSSEGIVLSRRNYAEADRIIVLLSRSFGKISLLAKGVRKPSSRKRGHLEVFSYLKFSASSGNGLDYLTEADTVDNLSVIRKNLRKTAVAYYFVEVIGKIIKEGEPNGEIFDLLLKYLIRIQKSNNLKEIRKEFVQKLLIVLGYWPENIPLKDPDSVLGGVIEKKLFSSRVGKKMLA